MTVKVSELQGAALDWAVAKCIHLINGDDLDIGFIKEYAYTPSTNWAQGGPIIEQERISVEPCFDWQWVATLTEGPNIAFEEEGPTPLIAAMRCHVANKMGDEIEVPDELMEGEEA